MSLIQTLLLLVLCAVIVHQGHGQGLAPFETNCSRNYIQDITQGVRDVITKTIKYNNVTYPKDKYFQRGATFYGCVCDLQLCISKCCTENHPKNITCAPGLDAQVRVDIYHDNLTLARNNAPHVSTHKEVCSAYELDRGDVYYIKLDGRLFLEEKHYDLHQYCILQDENQTAMTVRVCFDDEEDAEKTNIVHTTGFLISIPFLVATLLVYVILPDKKIQTKCLMAYLTCLTMAYFFLVYLQFNPNLVPPECEIIAACGVYFFMSTFCWMNVTCIDMYLTFSGKRAPMQGNSSKWKRFAVYCAFANGAPLVLVAFILGLNTLENFPGHPQFGTGRCWVSAGFPELLYFYGPMAILLTINTILFAITAHTIRTTMRDNQKMLRSKESQRHSNSNREDYILYIKLFVAMGINWIMEFISWFVNWHIGDNTIPWLWYPTDFCNAIYGMFIFIIFVCKRAVWIKLKQRYYIFMGKPNMARALSTHTSNHSHTERTNVDETTTTETNNYQIKMERM